MGLPLWALSVEPEPQISVHWERQSSGGPDLPKRGGGAQGLCANKLLGALMMLQFEDSGLDHFSFFSHQELHFIACKNEVVLISYVCELLKVWREN